MNVENRAQGQAANEVLAKVRSGFEYARPLIFLVGLLFVIGSLAGTAMFAIGAAVAVPFGTVQETAPPPMDFVVRPCPDHRWATDPGFKTDPISGPCFVGTSTSSQRPSPFNFQADYYSRLNQRLENQADIDAWQNWRITNVDAGTNHPMIP